MADRRSIQRAAAGLALVAALVVLALPQPAETTCRCGAGSLELVFVLDTTSSMKAVIGTVKAQCAKIIAVLEGHVENLKVGVVLYKTTNSPEFITRSLPLTADRKSVVEFLKAVKTSGGGFEAVEQGLKVAVDKMNWTKGARKVVVIVGDEPPAPENEITLYHWAEVAADRGIVVNSVTGSETAWRYYKITHEKDFQQMYEATGEKLKLDFRLPSFVKAAEIGGGKAVGGQNVREIVKWLLAFGLGREIGDDDSVDMDEFFRWKPGDRPALKAAAAGRGGRGRHLMARVAYRGEWRTPRDFAALHAFLSRSVKLEVRPEIPDVKPSDEHLSRFGMLYISGHGPVKLDDFEKRALKSYVLGGGVLWGDACCGRPEFDESFRALMTELFGRAPAKLAADHPVYTVGYRVNTVKVCTRHRSTEFVESAPGLEGIELNGRLAVVYSLRSLGSTWRTYRFGLPCQMDDEDGRRLSANIVLYFMTR